MMNRSVTTILLLVLLVAATIREHSAFSVSSTHVVVRQQQQPPPSVSLFATTTETDAVVTGPGGKAALNYDDDLRLTLQIIMDHQRRSSTVSTEQLVQQVTAAAAIVEVAVDLSIPYNAAAQLAYENESSTVKSSTTFVNYKIQYEAKAIADVIAKKVNKSGTAAAAAAVPVKVETSYDISIPYDAAANLAYEALSNDERSNIDYKTFQQQYVERAVADVIAKKASKSSTTTAVASSPPPPPTAPSTSDEVKIESSDVSIPYDSAAQLAFAKLSSIKHTLSYDQFKQQYEMNAVANVITKKLKREEQQKS